MSSFPTQQPARTLLMLCLGLLAASVSASANARSLSGDQLRCLAFNIYHEARGEGLDGQFAVAAVTLNRVRSKRYPDTICSVVWQRGQFSWTKDGRSDRPQELEAWHASMWVAATSMLLDQRHLVGSAVQYHTVSIKPRWAQPENIVRRIGRHIFYR